MIKPLDYSSNLVSVRMKEELGNVVTNTGPHVISDLNLPILVRQLAVHTNVSPLSNTLDVHFMHVHPLTDQTTEQKNES